MMKVAEALMHSKPASDDNLNANFVAMNTSITEGFSQINSTNKVLEQGISQMNAGIAAMTEGLLQFIKAQTKDQ
jgi:capsular polysaccharide biosynthesis protein